MLNAYLMLLRKSKHTYLILFTGVVTKIPNKHRRWRVVSLRCFIESCIRVCSLLLHFVLNLFYSCFHDVHSQLKLVFLNSELCPINVPNLTFTAQNIPEYEFPLTFLFQYKDSIHYSVLIREKSGRPKPVFWYILRSVQ